jgi:hypothetical protein
MLKSVADYNSSNKANKHTPSYRLRRHSICIYLAKPRHPVHKCHISIKSRKKIPLGFRDVPVFSQHPDPLSCFSFIIFNAVQYTHEILPPSFMEHKLQSVFYMTPVAGIPGSMWPRNRHWRATGISYQMYNCPWCNGVMSYGNTTQHRTYDAKISSGALNNFWLT